MTKGDINELGEKYSKSKTSKKWVSEKQQYKTNF